MFDDDYVDNDFIDDGKLKLSNIIRLRRQL